MTGVVPSLLDASAPPIKALQDSYGVTVTFKQRPRVYMTTVIVRGTVCKAKSVKEATVLLIEQLTGNRAVSFYLLGGCVLGEGGGGGGWG